MRPTARRTILGTLAAAPFALAPPARAATWPARDLRIIVPFPPGGTVGAAHFVRDGNDQHSLFLSQIASHGIAPALDPTIQCRPVEEFRAAALFVTVPNVWLASARRDLPRDVRAFLRDARANPDKYIFASAGNRTSTHLTGELIEPQTGTRILHVPYRGAGPGMTAVIAGEVDTIQRQSSDRAAADPRRHRDPARGDDARARARTARHAALADQGLRRALAERGTVPRGGPPEACAALMERELARWRGMIPEADLDAHRKGAFARRIGIGARPALRNIDTNLFDMDMKFADVEPAERVLAEIDRRFGIAARAAE